MPRYIRKGIMARPGTYKYGDRTEVKTAKELKAAAERQPSIMLTLGHPPTIEDDPKVKDYIGRVDQSWNERTQSVDAICSFYDEHIHKIPDSLQRRIINMEPLSISPGIMNVRMRQDEQEDILYNHVALLKEGSDPTCPLGECGINIRRESGKMNKRYEQKTEFTEGKSEDIPEPTNDGMSEVEALKLEVDILKGTIDELQKPTDTREPEKVETTDKPLDPVVADETPPEPEMVIPMGVKPRASSSMKRSEGMAEIIHQPRKSR